MGSGGAREPAERGDEGWPRRSELGRIDELT